MATTSTVLHFADRWEDAAAVRGSLPAQIHGDRTVGWDEFNRRANGVASAMLDAGVAHQDKVAQYFYNDTEYLQGVFAAFKVSLVPVNTNYRYTDDELVYLWDNADAAVVMFGAEFTDNVDRIRDRLPKVKLWMRSGEVGTCPDWATDWDTAAEAGTDDNVSGPWGRSEDDRWFLYTGGTTGMPKGVMWDNRTLVQICSRNHPVPLVAEVDLDAWRASVVEIGANAIRGLPGAPLMHGTGHITAIGQLLQGGCIVTLPSRKLDIEQMLDACSEHRVNALVIVGDAFARPILAALDAEPDRWDLSSMMLMVSSGAMWSQPVKERLLDHIPQMIIFDSLGSSEAIGMGNSYSSKASISTTAKFELGESAVVITEDGRRVEPGSGDIGKVGVVGLMPIGYYKDEVKTAATFPTVDGVRYSLPGDFATVEADGTITLLGRGSVCINTGGEKVFPEEVEEALKTHPDIVDAIAVGVPDERFGQAIVAVVEPTVGTDPDHDAVIAHVKATLASYKAPRHIFTVPSLTRAPNGKIDYKRWTSHAREQLGLVDN